MVKTDAAVLELLEPIRVAAPASGARPAPASRDGPTAMLVCHGMGQQVPFETLDALARCLRDRHRRAGGEVDIALRFVAFEGCEQPTPRAELRFHDRSPEARFQREVHLYEAYWAPLTEGAISYWQTATRLLVAGWQSLRQSIRSKRFDRWMFGQYWWLRIVPGTAQTLVALLVLLAPILLLALAAGMVLGPSFAWWVGNLVSHGQALDLSLRLLVAAIVLLPLIPLRRFVRQYLGDVIIYVSSHEVNAFWQIRDKIKAIGFQAAAQIYRALSSPATADSPGRFTYPTITVVGHSLGSVIAYDTLNSMIRGDQIDDDRLQVVERTQALITLGSPLDKVAFMFREHAKNAVVREALAAGMQPLIQDYRYRPPYWLNVFSKRDVISGLLDYFDPPNQRAEPRRVRNYEDTAASLNPVSAHTDYWLRSVASDILYCAAMGDLDRVEGRLAGANGVEGAGSVEKAQPAAPQTASHVEW